jgi:hypothetical protein
LLGLLIFLLNARLISTYLTGAPVILITPSGQLFASKFIISINDETYDLGKVVKKSTREPYYDFFDETVTFESNWTYKDRERQLLIVFRRAKSQWAIDSFTNSSGDTASFDDLKGITFTEEYTDNSQHIYRSHDRHGLIIIDGLHLKPFLASPPPVEPSGYRIQISHNSSPIVISLDQYSASKSLGYGINAMLKDAQNKPAGANEEIEIKWYVDNKKIVDGGYSYYDSDPLHSCLFDEHRPPCTWSRLDIFALQKGETTVHGEAINKKTGEVLATTSIPVVVK